MTPVYPYHIRRSEAGDCGELLLSLHDRRSAMVLQLNLEQSRILAVEMRGLATDHCTLHHMALAMTKAVGADLTRVIIKGVDLGEVTGAIRLEHGERELDVNVDVAAALAMALHLGLPIYMEGMHLVKEDRLQPLPSSETPPEETEIPQVFQQVIEALEHPSTDDDHGRSEA